MIENAVEGGAGNMMADFTAVAQELGLEVKNYNDGGIFIEFKGPEVEAAFKKLADSQDKDSKGYTGYEDRSAIQNISRTFFKKLRTTLRAKGYAIDEMNHVKYGGYVSEKGQLEQEGDFYLTVRTDDEDKAIRVSCLPADKAN